jgi:hypothetical protein
MLLLVPLREDGYAAVARIRLPTTVLGLAMAETDLFPPRRGLLALPWGIFPGKLAPRSLLLML